MAQTPRPSARFPLAVLLMAATGFSCAKDVVDALVKPLIWPNDISHTNSDRWLIQHHDELVRIEPRVLLLDFYNGLPSMQLPGATVEQITQLAKQQSAAQALGSRFHGYSDPSAPPFVDYQIIKTVDLTDHPGPPSGWMFPSSTLLPLTASGAFDSTALFTQTFGNYYQFPDPVSPARNLTLCELFEQGVINEVWVSIGEGPPRGIDALERKQVYDRDNTPIADRFEVGAGGGGDLSGITCGVTVRIAHLSPLRGLGCDLDIRSWTMQAETTLNTIPYLHDNALSFFNSDFKQRFGTPFDSWDDLCTGSSAGAPCVSYPTPTSVSGAGANGGAAWTIDPFIQGCGTATFPPNARYRDDYLGTTPVQSRCAHFQMGDGANGADLSATYTADVSQGYVAQLDALAAKVSGNLSLPGGDCGGGWQVYLRQSIPGYQNRARDSQGLPMKNWWPFMFY